MVNKRSLPDNETPVIRIVHEWNMGRKPLSFSDILFFIFMTTAIILLLITILGYRDIFGIDLGKPTIGTYLKLILLPIITCGSLSRIYNKTIVEISPRTLYVRNTPIPWPLRTRIPLSAVKQFKVKERVEKFGRRIIDTDYAVHAQMINGEELTIINDLRSKDIADDYLRRIEQAVGQLRSE